jgi:dTDP-glucose 4,6-dehydratase
MVKKELAMRKIVITGGAGFAGSYIVDKVCERFSHADVVVFDKMTYAGDIRNLSHHIISNRIQLVVGDVADLQSCARAVEGADLVIHAAAESHVDNSFGNSLEFTRTNVLGTHCLVEACRARGVPRVLHVSTDEVYGEVLEGAAVEETVLSPTNPYSASKAAAEMIIRGYLRSFDAPMLVIRANNLYGARQYPEKIIPRFICHMLTNRKLPVHGNGTNRRHYLSARDFADAVVFLAEKGEIGETYNVGTHDEYTNLQVSEFIATAFGLEASEAVEFVPDRPFNDARYSISCSKLEKMGWRPRRRLSSDISALVDWYQDNFHRYAHLFKSDESIRLPRVSRAA